MTSTDKPLRVVILVVAAFLVGAIVGGRADGTGGFADGLFGGDDADLSTEALEVIEENYFQSIDPEELERTSVRAMVRELRRRYEDRFSHYFDPDAYERFKEVTEGHFSGVGLTVSKAKRGLRVATVFDESPAREAGIRSGDVITAVDGRSIAGQDAELATALIKGRPGTEVTLTVIRPGTGAQRELELTRRQLEVPVVEASLKRAGGRPVAYVRLLAFSNGAHAELRREIERLDRSGAQGLVLDLRGNGGGLLTEAVLTASVFVEEGVIVSTEGRSQRRQVFEAVGDAIPERPTVVLINGDTASASEILAAALADAGVASIAGEPSFGKGSFQEVIPLDNGGALDLTVGEYETRDGDSLTGNGIEPELPARDRPATGPDEGLRRVLAALGAALDGKPGPLQGPPAGG